MPCDACGCACGHAREEPEFMASLLDAETAPGGDSAAAPSTGFSISWETVRSPFVTSSLEEERAKLTRCLFRALSVLLWLLVVDLFRGHGRLTYSMALLMAFFIGAMWSSLA
ncbi:hypothetical protein ACQJBY_031972 [Aegilops geniculata]